MAPEPVPNPAANSLEALNTSIESYRQQYTQAVNQLAQLEQNYHQQKEELAKALFMSAGAIAGLEQIVKNMADEIANDVKPPIPA